MITSCNALQGRVTLDELILRIALAAGAIFFPYRISSTGCIQTSFNPDLPGLYGPIYGQQSWACMGKICPVEQEVLESKISLL